MYNLYQVRTHRMFQKVDYVERVEVNLGQITKKLGDERVGNFDNNQQESYLITLRPKYSNCIFQMCKSDP